MPNENPAISVIVPVYNAEKYIGEVLEILLSQNFQDFEVITVDDCSTDNSCTVIENFIPKFGGRLKLLKLTENSGGPSVPRNKGLEFARGKYVFFMDNDDAIVNEAFQELYNFAEQTQADVVYCEKWGESVWNNTQEIIKNIQFAVSKNSVTQPSFFTDNLELRVREWINFRICVMPWLKLVRRDFLIENEIKFPQIIQEDSIWSFEVFIAAKRFLLIPNAYYIHRNRADSLASYSWKNTASIENLRRKLDRTINGLKEFDNWLSKRDFFQQRPDLRYMAVDNFMNIDFCWVFEDCKNLTPYVFFDAIKKYFGKSLANNEFLIPYLCARCITLTTIIKKNQATEKEPLPGSLSPIQQNRKERRKKK